MVKINLVLDKYLDAEQPTTDAGKQAAARSIQDLLSQIDHSVEQPPENNKEMLTRLLTSLKGEALNKDEVNVVEEIVGKGQKNND